jgi:hypothetical protein
VIVPDQIGFGRAHPHFEKPEKRHRALLEFLGAQ